MTIIFPRPLPAVTGIESSRFGLTFNTILFESPINRVAQTLKRPGSLWSGQYKLPPVTGAAARQWKAWLVSMQGPAGAFLGFDPDHRLPDGSASSATSTPLVQGASQSGTSIVTDGWAPNVTGLLLPGDYIQIGNVGTAIQLKIVTEQVDSDLLGQATINFEAALHKSPADNAPVIFANPVGVFRLEDNAAAAWEADRVGSHGFSFSFIEVPEVT
ncbi:MAG: hypothetical protein ACE5EM_12680 [Sphingomonadales bacterium]